jgi:hypothetical protein
MRTVITFMVLSMGFGLSACSGAQDDYVAAASDAQVNDCAELAGIAKIAMQSRQNGIPLDIEIRATQSPAEEAVVRNAYQLPVSTSPSNVWGITQTACLKALQ